MARRKLLRPLHCLCSHLIVSMASILAVLHSFVRVYAGEMSHGDELRVRAPEEGSERETETCNHFPESKLHKACCQHSQATCSEPDQQWSERMLSNESDVLWLQHEDSASKRYSPTYIYRKWYSTFIYNVCVCVCIHALACKQLTHVHLYQTLSMPNPRAGFLLKSTDSLAWVLE